MCERTLRGKGGDEGCSPVEVIVHVDAATLKGRTDNGDGLSAETCRRLLCDAGVVPLEEDRGKTIDVGRRMRSFPAAIRRAVRARDGGCRFPGCTNRLVDAHHVKHWIDGGETKLSNALSACRLCRARHKRHYADWRIMPRRAGLSTRVGGGHAA